MGQQTTDINVKEYIKNIHLNQWKNLHLYQIPTFKYTFKVFFEVNNDTFGQWKQII